MKPDEGAQKQIEIFRRMSGQKRLKIAFEMWEMALAQVKASEKVLHPGLNDAEIEKRARKRISSGTAQSY